MMCPSARSLCFVASLFCALPAFGAPLALPGGASVDTPPRWQPSGIEYRNAVELIATRKMIARVPDTGKEQEVDAREAVILISTEPRTSHADALQRLLDIAASRPEAVKFIEIGGWPALEMTFIEPEAQRGKDPGEGRYAQKGITAIAVDDKVQRFDITLAPDADLSLLREAQELARGTRFQKRGDPAKTRESIRKLSTTMMNKRLDAKPPARGSVSPAATAVARAADTGTAVLVQAGLGELEVAASANANVVIIASNQALAFSSNRAATFAAGNTGVFGLNDPSLARGASNNFYLGVIAFPTGTAAQLNVNGCTNAVSRSTDNGANFALQGFSAQCPLTNPGMCFPDQEHIAADSQATTAGGNDQLYAAWRNFTTTAPAASCRAITSGAAATSISCSQDNGVTWTARAAIAGAGDFPRVAVGRDGLVYVASVSGSSVLLNKFSSCANGLNPVAGFPVTVTVMTGIVLCPVPGLDRCNSGNTLSSPTPAPDPLDANHVFVAFAERDTLGGERVIVAESRNAGLTFPRTATASSATVSARRFMPWACSTRGNAYVGWYDRQAATAAGANNDLSEYFLGSVNSVASPPSVSAGFIRNLSGTPDPHCASGWPCVPRASTDSESCTVQPQVAGICLTAAGTGSAARCDFSTAGACPPGELCRTGGGCPKYGDYNGIACAGDFVLTAWTSATTPVGAPAGAGLRVFASAEFVGRKFRPCEILGNCPVPIKFDRDILVVKCLTLPCFIRDPVPKNCLVKWTCPGCSPGALCPPWYHVLFDDTIRPWKVDLIDGRSNHVEHVQKRYGNRLVLSFRPDREAFKEGEIGDYSLVFSGGPSVKAGVEYKIGAKLLVSDKPVPNLPR